MNFKSYLMKREFRFFWFIASLGAVSVVLGIIYQPMIPSTINAILLVFIAFIAFLASKNIDRTLKEMTLSEGRHSAIIDNLEDAVIVYDRSFKVLVFNPSAEKLYGLKASDVINNVFTPDKFKEDKYRMLIQTLFPSLAPMVYVRSEAGAYPQVADIAFNDPRRNFRVYTNPIYLGEKDSVFVKVINDRTKEMEVQKAKSEFISTAAHQLRTPLSAVIWALQIVSKETGLSPDASQAAKEGLLAGEKLSRVVTDLLDVSRIEEGKFGYDMKSVDITSFLENILSGTKDFISTSKLKVKLYFKNEITEPLNLIIDPDRLGMAISNIVDNAIKYNIENGTITVRLERLSDKPYVQISVEDTGIGIKEEDLDKLFTKFFRTEEALKAQPEGSGLGLYIARSIVRRHGGDVRVESNLGRGTKVSLTLPIDTKLVPSRELVYQE